MCNTILKFMNHQIKETIELPISIKESWEFFSNPNNLSLITPPQLGLKITSSNTTETYAGQIITYKIKPLLGLPMTWVTEITHLDKERYFVDEQRVGPYRMWHHQHRFTSIPSGTLIEDIVDYVLPYGVFGEIAHQLMVKKQLASIFSYRKSVLIKKFIPK